MPEVLHPYVLRMTEPTDIPPAWQLVFFPQAGAGTTAFFDWAHAVPEDVVAWSARLPGRGPRLAEPPLDTVDEVAAHVGQAIAELSDGMAGPLVLHGHSLGGLQAYATCRYLQSMGWDRALYLCVTASAAPHPDNDDKEKPTRWTTERVRNRLRELGGTPDEILNDQEMMNLIAPVAAADFAMRAAYVAPADTCEVDGLVVAGGLDPSNSIEKIRLWLRYLPRARFLVVEDGHFFGPRNSALVMAEIDRAVRATKPAAR